MTCWCWWRPTTAGSIEVSREALTFARAGSARDGARAGRRRRRRRPASTSSASTASTGCTTPTGDAFTVLRGRRVGRRGRGRRAARARRWCWRPARRGATRCWRTWPAGSTWPMAANVVAVDRHRPLVVTRQVLGGAALEEMRARRRGRRAHRRRPRLRARSRRARVTTPVVDAAGRAVADADLRARVVAHRGRGARRVRQPEVGAGRGRRRPRRRRPRRLQGPARARPSCSTASLGVSRVVTSLGWRPHHEQVGQTGSRISPDLYVACGISGAIQHWAGMLEREDDPRDQHRRGRADGDQGALRGDRRPARDRAGDQRGAAAPPSGLTGRAGTLTPCPAASTRCR